MRRLNNGRRLISFNMMLFRSRSASLFVFSFRHINFLFGEGFKRLREGRNEEVEGGEGGRDGTGK